ncbi:MAG: hypothetical protein K2X39_04425, partial [Silvanigrellaceae bacterium]|nr:hypothetical protein [Silvanigrellaceae bacterium]
KWHLNETRRLFAPLAAETNNYDALVLLKWIKEQKKKIISLGEVLQFSPVRDKKRRDLSLQALEDKHYLRLVKNKRKTLIQVNPWI